MRSKILIGLSGTVRLFMSLLACFLVGSSHAQLYINGADMVANNVDIGVTGTDEADLINWGGNVEISGFVGVQGNFLNTRGGIFLVRGTTRVGQLLHNDGANGLSFLTQEGRLILGGNLLNTSNHNTNLLTLILDGPVDQTIQYNGQLNMRGIVLEGAGIKEFRDEVVLDSVLHLRGGILQMGVDDTLTLAATAVVPEEFGLPSPSYVNGIFYQQGTGFKYFPIGNNGTFGPVYLEDVRGIDPEVGIRMVEPNPGTPRPGFELLGISQLRYWQLDVRSGTYDSSIVTVDLLGEDTTTIEQQNPLDVQTRAIAVAQSDSSDGEFNSIGNAEVADDFITSETGLTMPFFAIALAPTVPEGGLIYLPSAMSPLSPDPEDNVFKVYGEKINPEGFALRIFNKWGTVVYETEDFNEANQVGWNGNHYRNGTEQPAGVYSYLVLGQFENGREINEVGTITLFR